MAKREGLHRRECSAALLFYYLESRMAVFFLTEPVFGSFFPYGQFLLAGGRIWPYATRIFSTNC